MNEMPEIPKDLLNGRSRIVTCFDAMARQEAPLMKMVFRDEHGVPNAAVVLVMGYEETSDMLAAADEVEAEWITPVTPLAQVNPEPPKAA